ncbi:RNA-guided pseudouridylation complex pseudouridine synthase subunit Cbf5 [Candidatus Woesearchaeota archaeon]|nr:RNA-guided pseudouridylation complex pseudouridine synthase subunit Cbf5 [Candidatus Woesearchaeota archaeon]
MHLLPSEQRTAKVITKRKAETTDKYGKRPDQRSIEEMLSYSIINIDKPRGPTSHQVSAYVQQILGIKKSGHSGTLDPKVTGVLPVAIGRATRVAQALLTAGKEYIGIMHMHQNKEEFEVRKAFAAFTGAIRQLPPLKSAVKRQERTRHIYYLKLMEIIEKDVLFITGCEAGTYIRKLVHDLGLNLKCSAHMAELRRTKAGPFDESSLVTLQDVTDAIYYYKEKGDETKLRKLLLPTELAVTHLPKIWILDSTAESLCHGAHLALPGISSFDSDIQERDMVAVMTLKGELVCLGKALMNARTMQEREKGMVVKTDSVFMLPGTYPRAM